MLLQCLLISLVNREVENNILFVTFLPERIIIIMVRDE